MKRLTVLIIVALAGCRSLPKPIAGADQAVVVLSELESKETCTGFIIDPKGLILTASHCISSLQNHFLVELRDYLTFFEGTAVCKDVANDLGLIQMNEPPNDLVVLSLAPSIPEVGERVWVIGHPMSKRWITTTGKILSYRWLDDTDLHNADQAPDIATEIFETNAKTKPGNSGSPVLNKEGQVVGVLIQGRAVMTPFGLWTGNGTCVDLKGINKFLKNSRP